MRQLRVARALLLIAFTSIVYASIYPLHLHALSAEFLPVLIDTWRDTAVFVTIGDVAANFLLYVPLGLLTFFSLTAAYPRAARILIACVFGAALSAAMEIVQLFEVGRVSSFIDVIANSAGAVFGGSVARKLDHTPRLLERPAPLFLFGTWTAATVLLIFDRVHVGMANVLPLAAGAIAAATLLVEWWRGGYRLASPAAVAVLLVIALIWRELEPFHFSAGAQSFQWVPFAASFQASRGSGILVFADKVFFYGATVWFTRGITRSIARATLAIAALLVVLEALQMYQPGRTPEISDAILACAAGFVLYLLQLSPIRDAR